MMEERVGREETHVVSFTIVDGFIVSFEMLIRPELCSASGADASLFGFGFVSA